MSFSMRKFFFKKINPTKLYVINYVFGYSIIFDEEEKLIFALQN